MKAEPLVNVVRGKPTDPELAALVAVLVTVAAARSAAADARPPRQLTSAWTRSARPSMGPASWRASGLPS